MPDLTLALVPFFELFGYVEGESLATLFERECDDNPYEDTSCGVIRVA